jgi:L-lactate dehydrogenase complex protein LldF
MTSNFRHLVREAIQNDNLQVALDRNAEKKERTRADINASLPNVAQLRQKAKQIRQDTLENLERHLDQFTRTIEANGFIVHYARTDQEARKLVLDLVKTQEGKLVVKSKTMVSEEIHLNRALEDAGIEVVETDLGEFIVQLREEPPSHIVAPAIHLRREDVGQTFHEKLGMPYTDDVETMTKTARDSLREKFLSADVGISGVNFGVAETGTICIVTNEGNGRMVTTVPRMHIALMGMERIVPTLNDLEIMLRLLPRFATGQKLTSYISLIQGPRTSAEPDGPAERHLILIDNGRMNLRQSPLEEALLCIRCGSCLDHCPVYREIGGYSYESVYTGPIGSVISPGLFGMSQHGHLAKASTLCGACQDACPVDIDLPKLLLKVRRDYVEQVPQPQVSKWGIRTYTWIMERPGRLQLAQKLAAWGTPLLPKEAGWGSWLPTPLSEWTRTRNFPPFDPTPFRKRFSSINQTVDKSYAKNDLNSAPSQEIQELSGSDSIEQFSEELGELSAEFIRCDSDQVAKLVMAFLREHGSDRVLAWNIDSEHVASIKQELSRENVEIVELALTRESADEYQDQMQVLSEVEIGVTGATAGFADTGTLVLPSGVGQSQLASLLPLIHLAILPADKIYQSMSDWLDDGGTEIIRNSQSVALISGPSRTADIEMTLSLGVHGPGRVVVFCVE